MRRRCLSPLQHERQVLPNPSVSGQTSSLNLWSSMQHAFRLGSGSGDLKPFMAHRWFMGANTNFAGSCQKHAKRCLDSSTLEIVLYRRCNWILLDWSVSREGLSFLSRGQQRTSECYLIIKGKVDLTFSISCTMLSWILCCSCGVCAAFSLASACNSASFCWPLAILTSFSVKRRKHTTCTEWRAGLL